MLCCLGDIVCVEVCVVPGAAEGLPVYPIRSELPDAVGPQVPVARGSPSEAAGWVCLPGDVLLTEN